MKRTTLAVLSASAMALAGCGGSSNVSSSSSSSGTGLSFWPFGAGDHELDRRPANATEYRCAGNKAFYVRRLDDSTVWLIAPDREIRLDKQAEGRYGVGRVALELGKDGGASLTDPPNSLVGCTSSKK
ncbi:MAG: hypothetical protein ACRET8_03135 [Burkholderiales bacterium]